MCQGQAGFESFSRDLQAGLQVYATQSRMNRNDDEKKRIREQLRGIDRAQAALRNALQFQRRQAP